MNTAANAVTRAADLAATFGDRIRSRREQLQLSQHAVAHRVGVDQTCISQIEHGKRGGISFKLLAGLTDALEIDARDLILGIDTEAVA